MKNDDYFRMLKTILKFNDCPYVVIHYPERIVELSMHTGDIPERIVSWVYNSNTKRQHRDIAFYGVAPDFSKVKQPYKNPNDKRIRKLIENGSTGTDIYDWWNVNQIKNVSKEKTKHPCQMPIEVMKNIISMLPDEYTIVDPFMGSGTTGVACMMLGRDFIGVEMDEEYFKIAKERIKNANK